MATWPAGMPVPVIQDYRVEDVYSTLETPMESGPPRRAKLTSHYLSTGTVSMFCNATQMAALESTLKSAQNGAAWITGFPLDLGGGSVAHRVRIRNRQIQVVVPAITWRVTLQFETDERKLA